MSLIFAFKVINMVVSVFAESKLCVVSILKGKGSQNLIMDLYLDSSPLLKNEDVTLKESTNL